MDFLLKDGVKYLEHNFTIETEFENIVFAHSTDIFGTNSILFQKKKMKTNAGSGTIPDAFVIDIDKERWHIIEVELSTHPVYSHIVPQLTKFNTALKNPQTRKSLIRSFDEQIKADPFKRALLSSNGKDNETFRLLTDIVEKTPDLIIIIDKHNEELNDVSFPFKTVIRTFKTYARENYGLGDNIYHFDPIAQLVSIPTQIIKTEPTRHVPKSTIRDKDQLTDYIIPAIKQIRQGGNHKEVFKKIAADLQVKYSTVSDRCTRSLGKEIKVREFLDLIDSGQITDFLKQRFPNKEQIIERELK